MHHFSKQCFPVEIQISPFIYGWYRDDHYLYIGSSQFGCERISSHHIIGIKEPTQPQDVLHIWTTPEFLDQDCHVNISKLLATEALYAYSANPSPTYNSFVALANIFRPIRQSDLLPTLPTPNYVVSRFATCLHCKQPFTPKGVANARNFCSSNCQIEHRVEARRKLYPERFKSLLNL